MSVERTNSHPYFAQLQIYPPLESVTRPAVDTASAAYYLNRKQQTLRCWATYENGPVIPIRVGGRLAWKTADLRRVLCME